MPLVHGKILLSQSSRIVADLARYAPRYGGYSVAVQAGHEYARRARMELDIDEPSIEALQTLILLSQAMFQAGRGKKAYIYLSGYLIFTVRLYF
jgi:hypothetical protein